MHSYTYGCSGLVAQSVYSQFPRSMMVKDCRQLAPRHTWRKSGRDINGHCSPVLRHILRSGLVGITSPTGNPTRHRITSKPRNSQFRVQPRLASRSGHAAEMRKSWDSTGHQHQHTLIQSECGAAILFSFVSDAVSVRSIDHK